MNKAELLEKCFEEAKKELKKRYNCKSVIELAFQKYAEQIKK